MTSTTELQALLEKREEQLAALGGCGDGGCIVHRRGGQHTNGGCRCSRDFVKMQRFAYINNAFAKDARALIAQESERNG